MFSAEVWYFAFFVGIGSSLALDLWRFLARLMGIVILDWSLVGRWVLGLFHGHIRLCTYCHMLIAKKQTRQAKGFAVHLTCPRHICTFIPRASLSERVCGWGLHFLFGILCAFSLPLAAGTHFMAAPSLKVILLIGFGGCCWLNLVIIAPMLGAGLFFRKHDRPHLVQALLIAGHAVFAMAQYALALVFAQDGFKLLVTALSGQS